MSLGQQALTNAGPTYTLAKVRGLPPYTAAIMATPTWLKAILPPGATPSPRQRAKDLIAAIDAGGIPLNPMRVNDIARRLGLEVSVDAPMPETIERIRAALERR